MNNYTIQAKNFLKESNAKMTITYIGLQLNTTWGSDWRAYQNKYRVTLSTPQGRTGFTYWDSVRNADEGLEPSEYDILSCLQKYDLGEYEDFIINFGYEPSTESKRVYNAATKEYSNLCRIFTEEQMEALREIE